MLGEQLIAFRDSSGTVGVMDHRCPHRNASLFLGRNEEGGIRCVCQGWKFAADGTCLDQANVRPEDQFCDKVRANAYPTVERNGLIWCYLGPRTPPPPLPMIESTLLASSSLTIQPIMRECDWLQAIEALRRAGLSVTSSCEQGLCGTCETRVLAGVPDHCDLLLSAAEKAANNSMMICCSGSLQDLLVLDL